MLVLTKDQTRLLDQASQEEGSLTLMKNAGRAVFQVIQKHFKVGGKKIIILCGPGNNGGDGLMAAQNLQKAGFKVQLFQLSHFQGDALRVYETLSVSMKKQMQSLDKLKLDPSTAGLVVDALFGVGINRRLKGLSLQVVRRVNASGLPVISVDIPSGLDADTGKIWGASIKADATVTFGSPKQGFFTNQGPKMTGSIYVASIGLSQKVLQKTDAPFEVITPTLFPFLLNKRPLDFHKGSLGHVWIFGGSKGKLGAPVIASLAALKAGAGLVTLTLPDSVYKKMPINAWEVMMDPFHDQNTGYLNKFSGLNDIYQKARVIAVGPGLGTHKNCQSLVTDIIKKYKGSLILDADALNIIATNPNILLARPGNTLLTPHPAEMARLTNLSVKMVLKDKFRIARSFSKKYKVALVLKGYQSLLSYPGERMLLNPSGGPHMANGGQGDLLTGICAGLLSEWGWKKEVIALGVYLHGMIADYLTNKNKSRAVLASEIIASYNKAYRVLIKNCISSNRLINKDLLCLSVV